MAFAYASGSSYYLTQLYKNSVAVGTAQAAAAYSASTGFTETISSLSLNKDDVIQVRARTRSDTSYWTTAGMLVIEKL